MKNFLITGGAGFIGSHFAVKICNDQHRAIVLDKLTYAGSLTNLSSVQNHKNFKFIRGDIADKELMKKILHGEEIDYVVNFAAESHVDNSIKNPDDFILTNVVGTCNLLGSSLNYWQNLEERKKSDFRFLHISTDEVYGSLAFDDPKFTEKNSYKPNSPYSASKAASDHLVRAWHETYSLPTIVTNCSNNFGPHQHLEKLIPTIIYSAINKKQIPIYGDGKNVRDWIFVKDHVDGVLLALLQGMVGQTYCFGGNTEKKNIDLTIEICELLDELQPRSDGISYKNQITFVVDRPGHDRRYAIDHSKAENELGFRPNKTFRENLEVTVKWFLTQILSS